MTVQGATSATSYETQNLTKTFPGVVAVRDVSIAVHCGEVHGFIGKNGAGKTVLMSVLAGLYPATSGQLRVGGDAVELAHYSPAKARAVGIALIPQEPLVAPERSVLENVFMGRMRSRRGILDVSSARRLVADVCERFAVSAKADQPMGEIGIEDQQMLALGRALFIDRARIILLDEITASLSRERKRVFGEAVSRMVNERPEISFTLITHHIDEILEFCNRVTVMRDGEAVETLDVKTATKASLASWIVGTENVSSGTLAAGSLPVGGVAADSPSGQDGQRGDPPVKDQPVKVRADSLGLGNELGSLSFELKIGEICGIAGLDGSGKDAAFNVLAGIEKPERGSIEIDGVKVSLRSPRDARRAGIAYLPKKREQFAMISGRSVEENLLLMMYPRLTSRLGLISGQKARSAALAAIGTWHIKTSGPSQPIDALSGGNRQKVILARIVQVAPDLYLLNEPTRGVDIATKPELLAIIRSNLSQRACVLLTSESEEELVEVCDRIIVLYRGVVVADLRRGHKNFNAGDVYRLIQGVAA